MKKQVKKQQKMDVEHKSQKTTAIKWCIIGLGIAIVLAWIAWFVCDCIFISNGINIEYGETKILWWEVEFIKSWSWNAQWYKVCTKLATVVLSLLGGYVVLEVVYMVICGVNIKYNIKYYLYQLIITTASFIVLTISIIENADMMINERWVLDIIFLPPSAAIYHLDYLCWMSIALGLVIFTNVLMLASFKPFDRHTIIKDTNILMIVLAGASLILFVLFVLSLGWNDKFIGGASTIEEWLALAQDPITWKHIVCQCVTSPMGVFAGMVMVLMVIRLIAVMFVYNQKWGEKKSHIVIFSVIAFFTFAAFIMAHAHKLDFVKLINEYNKLKLACLLVMIAQTTGCLAAGTYCAISRANYIKRVNK